MRHGIRLLLLIVLVVSASGVAYADRDYEVASVDVNGDRTSINGVQDAWGNMQAFAPFSMAANGTKVAFVKRQGPFDHPEEYVPLAANEWCGLNGGCRDIYVRDLKQGKTTSVLSHLHVVNQDENSTPTIAASSGSWAMSADATRFLIGWDCQRNFDEPIESIGGTPICTDASTNSVDDSALVLIDIASETNEVIAVAAKHPRDFRQTDMSADGRRAVFSWRDQYLYSPAQPGCIKPNWECSLGAALMLWEDGKPLRIFARGSGFITQNGEDVGDWGVGGMRLSPDGRKVLLEVETREWDSFGPESKHMFVYDVDAETFSEIDLPWENRGFCNFPEPADTQYGCHNWTLIGSSFNGGLVYYSVGFGAGDNLAQVDVASSTVRIFEDVVCEQGKATVSYDGRYVACDRSNTVGDDGKRLPYVVVDTETLEQTEVATQRERFAQTNGVPAPLISSDGTRIAVLGHRSPEDDGPFGSAYPMQLYVTDVQAGGTPSPGPTGTFIDDDNSTFEADIEWLAAQGITKGCNPPVNDRFCPDDFVTRGQMAAFLHRALDDVLTPTQSVEFIDDNGNTFEADIEWLGGTGVTKGCNPPTNNRYCPTDFVTRGQMAAFLVRALGYTDDGGGNLFIDDNGSTFEADIDRLGTAGVTKGCNPPVNDQFCPTDFVTRGQMAAFLHRALGP